MGMSRSITLVIAYMLRRHKSNASLTPEKVLQEIRKSRPVACPNDGFMAQLKLYREMGCPEDVESHSRYQRWMYMRGVELATAAGMAPEWILFEDENAATPDEVATMNISDEVKQFQESKREVELRCRKCRYVNDWFCFTHSYWRLIIRSRRCLLEPRFVLILCYRRTLATTPYLSAHLPKTHNSNLPSTATYEPISSLPPAPNHNLCTSHFLHPLSWMRNELEQGILSGRLECPNIKCKAQIGRYAWQGIKCSCGIWVCPAFSLQKSRVDEITKKAGELKPGFGQDVAAVTGGNGLTASGIRMPPGMKRENLWLHLNSRRRSWDEPHRSGSNDNGFYSTITRGLKAMMTADSLIGVRTSPHIALKAILHAETVQKRLSDLYKCALATKVTVESEAQRYLVISWLLLGCLNNQVIALQKPIWLLWCQSWHMSWPQRWAHRTERTVQWRLLCIRSMLQDRIEHRQDMVHCMQSAWTRQSDSSPRPDVNCPWSLCDVFTQEVSLRVMIKLCSLLLRNGRRGQYKSPLKVEAVLVHICRCEWRLTADCYSDPHSISNHASMTIFWVAQSTTVLSLTLADYIVHIIRHVTLITTVLCN